MVCRRRPERNRARIARLGAVAAALLGSLLGCAGAQFQPTVPMRARTQDIDVELDQLDTGRARAFTLRTRSTVPHTLGRGWLTVASRHPCSGGAELDQVLIDGVPTSSSATLTPGAHQLKARLDRAGGGDFTLDLVVDIKLDDQSCLRAPVISQLLPLEAPKRPFLIGSTAIDGVSNLSGMRALTSFSLGMGLWVGSVLVAGHAGIGAATCHADVCGREPGGDLRSGWAVPLSADARLTVASPSFGFVQHFIALGVRYSFVPLWLPASAGEKKLGVHGLQGVLTWSFSDGLRGPFQHRERTSSYELTLPIGVFVDPSAPSQPVAFAGGLGVRLLFAL